MYIIHFTQLSILFNILKKAGCFRFNKYIRYRNHFNIFLRNTKLSKIRAKRRTRLLAHSGTLIAKNVPLPVKSKEDLANPLTEEFS